MNRFGTLLKIFGIAALTCASASAQVSTTTTLAVTQAGAAVTSVAPMVPVTLTATVAASGTSITPGQVTFCDASAVSCTDLHALGTAQLSNSGTAKLTLLPGVAGTHSYQARFLGTVRAAASVSNTTQLSVTPTVAPTATSVTALSASGVPGNYTLTATVTGSGTTAPTGVVSFVDATNSGYVLATATLGASAAGLSYTMGASYTTGTFVDEIAAGDFNNDGFPDIVTMNGLGSGTMTVLMNNGDGTFRTLPSFAGTTDSPGALAVGDFNGDGNLDIAIGDAFHGMLTILLGNGDGTFRTGATTVLPAYPANNSVGIYGIGVGDFNHDGIADIAVVDPWSQTLRVLLGNGDGTFNLLEPHPATGINPLDIAVGDFNGDGKLDLIICNGFGPGYSLTASTLNVFLGNGDGSFNKAADVQISGGSEQIFAADFDGDGKPDLAVNHSAANPSVLEVLSGNGDGTFTAKTAPQSLVYMQGIGIGDLNGDGQPDFGGAFDQLSNNVSGLISNRDGTFTLTQPGTDSWQIPAGAVVADFKGVGYGEIAVANQQNGITIMEPQWTATATATVTGISPVGTGTHYAYAVYSGDANYSGSASNQVPLTAELVVTALSLTASSSTSIQGQSVTLVATLNTWSAQNHTASQSVTFFSNGVILGTGTVTNGVATLSVSTLAVGTDNLTASYAGDTNFAPSTSLGLPHTVTQSNLTSQTINFPQPASPVYTGTSITLTASASSGLPVTFSVLSGPATLSGRTLNFTGPGTVFVAADQAGDATYSPAPEVVRSITVISPLASVNFALSAAPNPVFVQSPLTLTATLSGSAGLPTGIVTFLDGSSPLGQATVTAGTASIMTSSLSVGPHTITATYGGSSSYSTAVSYVIVTVQDFGFTATDPYVTIFHGGTATYSLMLSTMGGAGMASTVNFSLSGAPDSSRITFTPPSLPAGSGTTPVTLVIQTPNYPTGPFASNTEVKTTGISLAVLALGGLLLPFRRMQKKTVAQIRRSSCAMLLLISVFGIGLTGCGSGWQQQQWTMNVTASSGTLSHTTTLYLTSRCQDLQPACPIVN